MVIDLYKKCNKFLKLAENVSIEENDDPILKKLSDLKSFDDRIGFAKKHWKFLGEGSSRTAFQMNKDLVIKVAHNDKGIAQCLTEMDPKTQLSCTNPIVVADAKGKWIVLKNTEPMTEEKFKELTGFGFESFMNAIYYKFNNELDNWNPPQKYEEIEKHPLFQCLAKLIFSTDQQIGDVAKISSFRILDGEPVLADYGLSRDVYKKFYKSDSSSKTKSSSS